MRRWQNLQPVSSYLSARPGLAHLLLSTVLYCSDINTRPQCLTLQPTLTTLNNWKQTNKRKSAPVSQSAPIKVRGAVERKAPDGVKVKWRNNSWFLMLVIIVIDIQHVFRHFILAPEWVISRKYLLIKFSYWSGKLTKIYFLVSSSQWHF